jgi:hypothetical protein
MGPNALLASEIGKGLADRMDGKAGFCDELQHALALVALFAVPVEPSMSAGKELQQVKAELVSACRRNVDSSKHVQTVGSRAK